MKPIERRRVTRQHPLRFGLLRAVIFRRIAGNKDDGLTSHELLGLLTTDQICGLARRTSGRSLELDRRSSRPASVPRFPLSLPDVPPTTHGFDTLNAPKLLPKSSTVMERPPSPILSPA